MLRILLVISYSQAAKGGSESSMSDAPSGKPWKILKRFTLRPCQKSKLCLRNIAIFVRDIKRLLFWNGNLKLMSDSE
jgi:hypothetical protein